MATGKILEIETISVNGAYDPVQAGGIADITIADEGTVIAADSNGNIILNSLSSLTPGNTGTAKLTISNHMSGEIYDVTIMTIHNENDTETYPIESCVEYAPTSSGSWSTPRLNLGDLLSGNSIDVWVRLTPDTETAEGIKKLYMDIIYGTNITDVENDPVYPVELP